MSVAFSWIRCSFLSNNYLYISDTSMVRPFRARTLGPVRHYYVYKFWMKDINVELKKIVRSGQLQVPNNRRE